MYKFNQKRILQVVCGTDYTVCLDEDHNVWSWGLGAFGNLGHGGTLDEYFPKQVETLAGKVVRHISAGAKHTLAVTLKGDLWAFGSCEDGRLGNGELHGFALYPQRIEGVLEGVVVCQADAGEAHSGAVDTTGSCYTWGAGSYGRLGHGEDLGETMPVRIHDLEHAFCSSILCSAFHSMVVTSEGQVS
jgi:E3 ubiquitin-protein ligase HERC2